MANKKPQDRVGQLVREVEHLAKRLRADIRKRANEIGLLKNINKAADQLRKRAAAAAGQVEKYVHEIRKELEGAPKPVKRAKAKPKKRKKAPRPAAPVAL